MFDVIGPVAMVYGVDAETAFIFQHAASRYFSE
jgi:hypothetical protein